MRTHRLPHEEENAAAAAQHERELTRRALRGAAPVDEELMAEQDRQPHYVAARREIEAERARRAEDLHEARERAAAKLDLLNQELDRDEEAKAKFGLTEAQFLGNEPMRVGYEDAETGRIIVGNAKITPAPDGGFMLTIDDAELTDETVEVLEGEVIDGSKPWVIGQDAPTEVVEELTRLPEEFEQKGYVQGYQDGVTDTHQDERDLWSEAFGEGTKVPSADRSYAVDEEPAPVDQGSPSVHDLVVSDFEERKQHGLNVYGVTLQGGNGRDQLRDAYMEALDLTCYLRAALFERDGK